MHYMGDTIEFDTNRCIKCTKCVTRCKNASVNYLEIKVGEDGKKYLDKISGKHCIHCGQCTLVCPVNAIRYQSEKEKVKEILKDKSKTKIVQCAPSIRAAICEGFNIELDGKTAERKLNTVFRKLGFDKIFDVSFGADITTMVEAEELVDRLNDKDAKLPMFTSCCHAWVEYCLNYHPELRENLTTARSPHIHSAAAYKIWWAAKENINPKDIIIISIMPCTSKKEECLDKTSKIGDIQLVDSSLILRELIELIKENNIDFANIEESDADAYGEYSGAGIIYGVSGGVMESALRTAYKIMTGDDLKDFDLVQVRPDTDGLKSAEIYINGRKIRVAVAATVQNLEKILEELKTNPDAYHYVEVMSCLGGCIGGGGMPLLPNKPTDQAILIKKRKEILMNMDRNKKGERTAQSNPMVAEYMKWIRSQNDLHLTHDVYHLEHKKREMKDYDS